MGYAIDPRQSWLPLAAAAERETDDRRRRLILEVRDHMEAEINGRLEPLMATLTAEPRYHFWGSGPQIVLEGREAVAAFYSGMFETGGQQFEVVVEKVLATSDHVVTEGRVKQVYRGGDLKAMGLTEIDGNEVLADSLWLSDAQLVTLWPADDAGKLIGEDIYFGQDPMTTLTPVARDDLPPYYQI